MASIAERIAEMTLDEKLAQLVGLWAGASRADEPVAPMADQLLADSVHLEKFAAHGLGQLTRHYGTKPISVADGVRLLAERQRFLTENTRPCIPALVHEEALTGVLAWGATTYPTPLAWGATFDAPLIRAMGRRIGQDLAALGVHQALAPVLDVVRDLRWGRVEECIGEDPLLVAEVGTAYVQGLEDAGRVATLKHFAGYSGSQAGRNHAPVSAGRRELEDVFLPPFERAIRLGGARSVMNSYTDVDGIPVAADPGLLTGVLRERWGFTGTVVADYFAVTFLQTMHAVAATPGEAAGLALAAGIDVELPTGSAYLGPLRERVLAGSVPEELVDRALERVLRQKHELGLLEPGWQPEGDPDAELDGPEQRDLARRVAEQSIVLLENDGILPLQGSPKLAVIGPNADRAAALFGCYSFVQHVLARHPDVPLGIDAPTVREVLEPAFSAPGCAVTGDDRSGFAAAVEAARAADVAILVLGDESGMFGRGTSGEGCDVTDLRLPGVQSELAAAVLDTGTPVVVALLTGRPYELAGIADRAAAVLQVFFPGQEGALALADVLTGAISPSGRLPVGIPAPGQPQPSTYRHGRLAAKTGMSSADPTPAYPFGFGRSYTTFAREALVAESPEVDVTGDVALRVRVRNTGERPGAEVVQLYVTDEVASAVRPVRELVGFARIELDAGETADVRFAIPARALSFVDRTGARVIEPGLFVFRVASDAADEGISAEVTLTGDRRVIPDSEYEVPTWDRL